jgi:hypothetical protein
VGDHARHEPGPGAGALDHLRAAGVGARGQERLAGQAGQRDRAVQGGAGRDGQQNRVAGQVGLGRVEPGQQRIGPAGLAVARLAVASAALALVAPVLGVRRPRARDLPLIAVCGLAGMTGYQLLLNAGERVVPAGTASLLVATARSTPACSRSPSWASARAGAGGPAARSRWPARR